MPTAIIVFFLAENKFRPLILVVFSLIFFLWKRPSSLEIITGLIVLNFSFGNLIERWRFAMKAKVVLFVGVASNLSILFLYKLSSSYGSSIVADSMARIFSSFSMEWFLNIVFPVGLSYLAFQFISYLVDVYKGVCVSEKSFLRFCLYIFFFPKILSGPITLYRSISDRFSNLSVTVEDVANGMRRFTLGMGKKVLIADHLAKLVDAAFGLESPNFEPQIAWLVLIGFALQLFFDFSGYIDMALGIGQALGVRLPENFDYPYLSRSIGEFWRRWHITLSNWFREYVFFPLERRRLPIFGQQINIMIVFLLTGLWHGLTLPYVFWGLTHGIAIVLESTFFGRWLKKTWQPIQHAYALSVILLGWVFFRSNSLEFAWLFLRRLFGDLSMITVLPFVETRPLPFIEPTFLLALIAGLIFAFPVLPLLEGFRKKMITRHPVLEIPIQVFSDMLTFTVLWFSIAALTSGGFLPGIYDRF